MSEKQAVSVEYALLVNTKTLGYSVKITASDADGCSGYVISPEFKTRKEAMDRMTKLQDRLDAIIQQHGGCSLDLSEWEDLVDLN